MDFGMRTVRANISAETHRQCRKRSTAVLSDVPPRDEVTRSAPLVTTPKKCLANPDATATGYHSPDGLLRNPSDYSVSEPLVAVEVRFVGLALQFSANAARIKERSRVWDPARCVTHPDPQCDETRAAYQNPDKVGT